MSILRFSFLLLCSLISLSLQAELLTQKQRFELSEFTTLNGRTLNNVAVGWESYGTLNEDKSNAILVTHYFSGTSHAAGKYSPDDKQPGYWDAIIGPGKAIDTDKYYVISVDTLVNLNVHDPNVITTGPASINPDTGKPYGLDFPVVTIRDFINVQKAVLDSLGIERLHAVIGPSMGSLQALDWASAYPDRVARMISVIGAGQIDAWTTAALEKWAMPIRLDPLWNAGNYYDSTPPTKGVVAALMTITQEALHPQYFNQVGAGPEVAHQPLNSKALHDINSPPGIVSWLHNRAQHRADMVDANHLLYLVRANQLFIAGHQNTLAEGLKTVSAKSLFIVATNDLILMPYLAETAHASLQAAGKQSSLVTLEGGLGHFEGIVNINQHAHTIREFLAE